MRRLMGRGDGVMAVWATVLLVIWIPSWAIWHPDSETTILLSIAIAATYAKAAVALARERRAPGPGDRHPIAVVETTHATSLAGVAIVGLALGLEFGPWLLYVSGGLLVVAVGGLLREHRAARRMLEGAKERRDP